MASVFLSYGREDFDRAQPIAVALERAGHTVWWDRRIKPGAEFSKVIEAALESANAVVVLWSARAVESPWVRDEAAIGRDTGRLVPASLDKSQPPLGFRQYQTIDLSDAPRGRSSGMESLIDAIAHLPGAAAPPPLDVTSSTPPVRRFTRRNLVIGVVAATALGGSGLLVLRHQREAAPPGVEPLFAQAWQAWTQGTNEGYAQATGLYLRATQLAPDYPDAWGFLGCIYADRAHFASVSEQTDLRERAREAGRRALRLDPQNAYGRMAVAYARPLRGNWLLMEREFRQAMSDQPGKPLVTYSLALSLTRVGRLAEAAALFNQLRGASPTASQYQLHIRSLWGSGQIGEAERLLQEAIAIYALNASIWTIRFDMLMASGHAAAAAALAQDTSAGPGAVSDGWLDRRVAFAKAAISRTQADIDAVASGLAQDAREDAVLAKRSIEELSMLGRIDEAFTIAAAYFFSRGFVVPDVPVVTGLPTATTLASRETLFLFLPPVRALRADPRFDRLVDEIGLTRYWREVGVQPDYRKA